MSATPSDPMNSISGPGSSLARTERMKKLVIALTALRNWPTTVSSRL